MGRISSVMTIHEVENSFIVCYVQRMPSPAIEALLSDFRALCTTPVDQLNGRQAETASLGDCVLASHERGRWTGPVSPHELMPILVRMNPLLSLDELVELCVLPPAEKIAWWDCYCEERGRWYRTELAVREQFGHGPVPHKRRLPVGWRELDTAELRRWRERLRQCASPEPADLARAQAEMTAVCEELARRRVDVRQLPVGWRELDTAELRRWRERLRCLGGSQFDAVRDELARRQQATGYERQLGNVKGARREELRDALRRRAQCYARGDREGLERARADIRRLRGKTLQVHFNHREEPPWERYTTLRACREALAKLKRRCKVAAVRGEPWDPAWAKRGEERVRLLEREEYEYRLEAWRADRRPVGWDPIACRGRRPHRPGWLVQEQVEAEAAARFTRQGEEAVLGGGRHLSHRERRLVRWVARTSGRVETGTHKCWPWHELPAQYGRCVAERMASSFGLVEGELWFAFRR